MCKDNLSMKYSIWAFAHLIILKSFALTGLSMEMKSTINGPPLPGRPFVVAWDVASEKCEEEFGVKIDLDRYDIISNSNKGWQGNRIYIFYGIHLGLYPTFKNGKPVNGGLPQSGNIGKHISKAASDITTAIPDEEFQGLAVIDWESWHVTFDRYGESDNIFREKSIEKVMLEHPKWPYDKQVAFARFEYNTAARQFIESTLQVARFLRPKTLWGFYLYPNCFNYDKTGTNLKCSKRNMALNDDIQWMFDESTALYPSVYLGEWFKDKISGLKYVANRIKESQRLDYARPNNSSIPIYPYHMLVYKKETKLLDYVDLKHTIAVSALLGTSGMVIWGGRNLANSVERCLSLKNYVDGIFGPFCKRVSSAATKCSTTHCSGHGRCVVSPIMQTESTDKGYLTGEEAIELLENVQFAVDKLYDKRTWKHKYMKNVVVCCQCYKGWSGADCSLRL